MNNLWSNYIQSIESLYFSRSLRFSDFYKKQYLDTFNIKPKKILEIGCGPGALCESLKRWYPQAEIYGVDTDSNFLAFARQIPNITFLEDDATSLTFEDQSFDVTISNTVVEHINPSKFYSEQYRVLKENGICLVLSTCHSLHLSSPCIIKESEFEQEIWKKCEPYFKKAVDQYNIGKYHQNQAELPLNMEKYGFKEITTEYITINLTPDHPCFSKEMAHAMIQANRQQELGNANNLLNLAKEVVSLSEINELKRLINIKYDQRMLLYDQGIKQWDTDLVTIMVVRGIKK